MLQITFRTKLTAQFTLIRAFVALLFQVLLALAINYEISLLSFARSRLRFFVHAKNSKIIKLLSLEITKASALMRVQLHLHQFIFTSILFPSRRKHLSNVMID